MPKKSKLATIILSALPGAGHMYLGWRQRGLLFMLAFFLTIFLMDWIGLSLFAFLLPVIWFYSLFDALQCYDEVAPPLGYRFDDWNWFFKKQRWVGIGLIVIGSLILLNKLAYPMLVRYLSYEVVRVAGVSLVALLLIAGGIRLAWGKPISPPKSLEEKMPQTGQPLPEEKIPAPVEPSPPAEENSLPEELLQEEE